MDESSNSAACINSISVETSCRAWVLSRVDSVNEVLGRVGRAVVVVRLGIGETPSLRETFNSFSRLVLYCRLVLQLNIVQNVHCFCDGFRRVPGLVVWLAVSFCSISLSGLTLRG